MRIKNLTRAFLLLALIFLPLHQVNAQSDSSSLSGAVLDSSGAILTRAKVTVRNNATRSEQVIMTMKRQLYPPQHAFGKLHRAH